METNVQPVHWRKELPNATMRDSKSVDFGGEKENCHVWIAYMNTYTISCLNFQSKKKKKKSSLTYMNHDRLNKFWGLKQYFYKGPFQIKKKKINLKSK